VENSVGLTVEFKLNAAVLCLWNLEISFYCVLCDVLAVLNLLERGRLMVKIVIRNHKEFRENES
jgi:hypothetical protein